MLYHLLALASLTILLSPELASAQFNFGGFQPAPAPPSTQPPTLNNPSVAVGDGALRSVQGTPLQPLPGGPNRFHNFQPVAATNTPLNTAPIDQGQGTPQPANPGPALNVPSSISNSDAIFIAQPSPQPFLNTQVGPNNAIGATTTTLVDPATGQIFVINPQIQFNNAPLQPSVSSLPSSIGTPGSLVSIDNTPTNTILNNAAPLTNLGALIDTTPESVPIIAQPSAVTNNVDNLNPTVNPATALINNNAALFNNNALNPFAFNPAGFNPGPVQPIQNGDVVNPAGNGPVIGNTNAPPARFVTLAAHQPYYYYPMY